MRQHHCLFQQLLRLVESRDVAPLHIWLLIKDITLNHKRKVDIRARHLVHKLPRPLLVLGLFVLRQHGYRRFAWRHPVGTADVAAAYSAPKPHGIKDGLNAAGTCTVATAAYPTLRTMRHGRPPCYGTTAAAAAASRDAQVADMLGSGEVDAFELLEEDSSDNDEDGNLDEYDDDNGEDNNDDAYQ